jgi:hypothetical protein
MILLTILSKKIEPKQTNYFELTDTQFSTIVNHLFHYATNDGYDPFVFVDKEGDYAEFEQEFDFEIPRRFLNLDGTHLPSHEERLAELANGDLSINDVHPRVFLNELIIRGLLPKGDYLIVPEEPEVPTVNFILI